MTNLDSILKSRDNTLLTKVHLVKVMVFWVVMYGRELDHKESRALKNWCFQTVVLEKSLESHLACKQIKQVHPKGNQSSMFIRGSDAEAEAPIICPPDVKDWHIGKNPDAGKDWRQEESSVQSLSRVQLFVIPLIAVPQAPLSIANSQSLLKPMSIESVLPSNHLILCHPLLLLPPIPHRIRVFSNESTQHMRWPKQWSFSFSITPSNEHPGLISFRMDRLDLLAVQGTLKTSPTWKFKRINFGAQRSLQSNSHIHTWPLEKW